MQHLKRRHKKSLEVQDSRTKKAQGNSEEIHEVDSQPAHWWHTGQWTVTCPVYIGLSGGTLGSLRRGARKAPSGCSTGLSGVHWTIWVMVGSNGRLLQTPMVGWRDRAPDSEQCMSGVPDCPVCPSTGSCCFFPTTIIVEGGFKYPPTGHFKVWEPSNIPRHIVDISKCSNTQVLNRITRWLA
jgi:hypothetical protein